MIRLYLLRKVLPLILAFCCTQAWAQNRVTGRVTSGDDGTALPGVSILEKGTSNGTVTSEDGNYTMSVGNNAVLVFSFVGFVSQEVDLAGKTTVNVVLQPDVTSLNEVVIIGYGEQQREDVTGSVTAITSRDFNKGVLTSPQDLLVGKLAGVQVTSNNGAPGSGATIRIRGGSSLTASNDPLYVIDGFPVDSKVIGGVSNPLAAINPNDIESFTVLKDASATAIYGSRASNGVIIITTKKGKDGKPQVSYNGNVSLSTPAKYFDVLSGDEMRALVNEKINDTENPLPGLNVGALSRLGNANTDWQKEIYRNAVSHDHNISFSGTANHIPVRVSYGFTDQQGILKNTDSKRHSLNLNLSPSFLNDNLKVNLSAKASNTKNNFGNTGAVGAAVGFDPTQPVRNGNTRYGGYFTWVANPANLESDPVDLAPSNPVALIDLTNNTSNVNRLLGNIQVDYRLPFLPDMRVNVNAGIDYSDSDGINNTMLEAPWATDQGEGQRIDYTGKNRAKLFDIYANYVKEVGQSKFDITAGHSYQSFRNDGTNFSRNWEGTKFYDNDYIVESDGDSIAVPRQYIPEINYLLSFFGRAQYSFADRYLLTLTLRSDGSSRFADAWGLFPAAAFAWNIINENFLQNSPQISNLKLRLGWGITGQQNLGSNSYPYLPVYQLSTPTASYQFGNTYYNTLRPNPYDANIKWEETTTLNAGLDFGFFNDRFTGTIDVYHRETRDLINFIPIAAGSNFSNYLTTNVGSLENRGIELTLSSKVIERTDLEWTAGFNFTHNRNEITKLTKTNDPNYIGEPVGGIGGGVGNTIQIHSVGYPASSFFVFQQVYDESGNPIEGLYVDRSGSGGVVSSSNTNKYRFHSPQPLVMMGVNSNLRYKKFDMYFSGRFSLGNYVYNNRASGATYSALYVNTGFFNNLPDYIYDTHFNNVQYWSDFYIENASFFKMDNISVGYTLDQLMNNKLRARFSLTVQNAFMVTKYSGIDPEVDDQDAKDGYNPGIDNSIYPRPRNFVFGVNVTF